MKALFNFNGSEFFLKKKVRINFTTSQRRKSLKEKEFRVKSNFTQLHLLETVFLPSKNAVFAAGNVVFGC